MTWATCRDKMPPDDETRIIIKSSYGYQLSTGLIFHSKVFLCEIWIDLEWTPYTPELWEELNK